MAIVADREQVDMTGMTTEVVKIMGSNQEKIAEIQVILSHPGLKSDTRTNWQAETCRTHTCPVALSLHESVKQTITFNFRDFTSGLMNPDILIVCNDYAQVVVFSEIVIMETETDVNHGKCLTWFVMHPVFAAQTLQIWR